MYYFYFLGEERGFVLEVIVFRINFILLYIEKFVRIVGLFIVLVNVRDFVDWFNIY